MIHARGLILKISAPKFFLASLGFISSRVSNIFEIRLGIPGSTLVNFYAILSSLRLRGQVVVNIYSLVRLDIAKEGIGKFPQIFLMSSADE